MTEMNVGRLVAYASIDSKIFEAGELKIRRALIDLNRALGTSVAGVRELDLSMIAGAESATDLGAGLARAAKASTDSTRATQRDAAAEDKRNAALARARELVASVAGEEKRLQQSLIRQAAVTDRVTEAEERGNLTARQYLANQAAMIGASRSVASAQAAAGASIAATGRKMESAGKSIGRHITLPVLAAIGVSAHLASTFDSTMTRIQTQAGASAGDVKVLSGEVLDLAKTAEQGPTQLAQALYHLKSVGLDNVDAMKALKQASDLAAVGGADLEDTTNALAGAWRTGIKGATNFHDAVRTLNAVIGAGNMSTQDLNAALGTGILPTAKTFGLTLKDVGSALALFTDEGVPAAAAATRLRMTFSLLGAPSQVAQKQLASIGITANELGVDMRKPNGLIVAVGDLKQHLDDSGLSATKQAALLSRAFGGGRSSSAILSMINNYDVLGKKQDQVTAGIAKYDKAVATQRKTPTAQFHLLGAELERTSILLGNAVLPDLIKLTSATAGAVRGFDNLSHTQKEILGWGVGTLAALGPILAIGGRLVLVGQGIGTFVTFASTRLAALAGASEATSATVGLSMARMGAAIGGAGIGIAVGELTKNSGTATKAIGALAAAGTGAAIGFGVGGPVGAAIGGLAGGVGDLAVSFLHAGDSGESSAEKARAAAVRARAAIAQQRQAVEALTTAIDNDSDAIGKNTRVGVVADLQKSGALKLAQQANLNLPNVTGAALGNRRDQAALQKQISARLYGALQTGGLLGTAQSRDIQKLLPLLRQEGIYVGAAGRQADREAEGLGKVSFATRTVADETRRYGASLDTQTVAGRANVKFIHDHVEALGKERSSGKLTDQQWATQLGTLQRQLKQYGENSTGVANYIKTFAHIPASVRTALLADPKIANSAIGTVLKNIQNMPKVQVTSLTAQNNTGSTLANLAVILDDAAKTRVVTINADTDRARSSLETFLNTPSIKYVQVQTIGAGQAPSGGHALFASGGTVGGVGNRDTQPAMLTPGEEVTPKRQATKYRPLLKAIARDEVPGYATGGTVGGGGAVSQIIPYLKGLGFSRAGIAATLGNWKVESGFNPNAYNPGENAHGFAQWEGGRWTALQNYAAQHNLSPTSTAAELGYFAHELHHGYGSTLAAMRSAKDPRAAAAFFDANFEGSSGSTRGARESNAADYFRQLKGNLGDVTSPTGGGGGGSVGGSSGSTSASAAASKARQAAATRMGGARAAGHDVRSLGHIASMAGNTDLRSQLVKVEGDLRTAGLPKAFTDSLAAENKHILALARTRNIGAKHLAAATKAWADARKMKATDIASFRGSVIGSFDITSAGKDENGRVTGGSLRAAQAQDLTRVRQYVTDLTKLSRKGIFPAAYLRQLASQGPDALPTIKALLSMSAPQLAGFARNQQEIAKLGGQVATVAATRLDQGTIDRRARLVQIDRRREHAEQRALSREINDLGKRIEDIFEHKLHLKIDWRTGDLSKAVVTDARKSGHRPPTNDGMRALRGRS